MSNQEPSATCSLSSDGPSCSGDKASNCCSGVASSKKSEGIARESPVEPEQEDGEEGRVMMHSVVKEERASSSSVERRFWSTRTLLVRSERDLYVWRKERKEERQSWRSRSWASSCVSLEDGEERGSSGEGTEGKEDGSVGVEGTECVGEGGDWRCDMRSWFCW